VYITTPRVHTLYNRHHSLLHDRQRAKFNSYQFRSINL